MKNIAHYVSERGDASATLIENKDLENNISDSLPFRMVSVLKIKSLNTLNKRNFKINS